MEPSPCITLVQPPIEDFYLTPKRTIPYGLASIAAGLIENGFCVEIIDGLATTKRKIIPRPGSFEYLEPFYKEKDISLFGLFHDFYHFGYSYEHIARLVKEKKPFLVGIASLFTPYAGPVLKVAKAIKKAIPDAFIVAGGHHPTQFPMTLLENPNIDFVIRGEAEHTMPHLARALLDHTDLRKIKGIGFKENHHFFIDEPAWIEDLSALPLPRFELIKHKFYSRKKRKAIVIVSSRGCPMPCSYCSVSSTSNYAKYRQRPVDEVIKEITMQLKSADIGFIDFEDENLCLRKKWFLKLFERLIPLIKGKAIELRAMNGLYPGSLDEENVSILKKAGFKTLNLSLGSTSGRQLKKFKRPDIRTDFENALELAEKYNLDAVSYLIAAAPDQSAKGSLNDLIHLAARRTLIGLSIYYPAPGSRDYNLCLKKNVLPSDPALFRSSALPIEDTTSRTEAITLLRLSRIINFIKSLLDHYGHLDLNAFDKTDESLSGAAMRTDLSVQLLKSSLEQEDILGMTPEHKIIHHHCDKPLVRQFTKEIRQITFCGVKTRAKSGIKI